MGTRQHTQKFRDTSPHLEVGLILENSVAQLVFSR